MKRSAAARIRPFWMPIAFIGALVLAGAAFIAIWPGFDPQVIGVSGNRRVPTSEILARAAISSHISIWVQNTDAIARRVETIPYIGAVRVRRLPPASVTIAVSERAPFAILRGKSQSAVVDRALRVLCATPCAQALPLLSTPADLGLVAGAFVTSRDAVTLRDAYSVMLEKGLAPVTLSLDGYGELVAVLPNGLRLLLGEPSALAEKMLLTKAILAQVVRGQRRVSAIDLRAPSTPVIVYR